jgi:outer membrane protein assembly factor BamD
MTATFKMFHGPNDAGNAMRRQRVLLLAAGLVVSALFAGCGSKPKTEAPTQAAERLYQEAKDDIQSGSWERAAKSLERVEGLAAGTLLAQQAQLELAYVQWRADERTPAMATIDRFIKLNPSSPALDYAMYLKGLMNFNSDLGLFGAISGQQLSERDQRAARDSHQAFKQLVEQFPSSRYSPDARERMAFIVNSLAEYEVHVARYYYRRGAYVAAAGRAQQAVSEYQQSPAIEEALAIMVQSYDRLNLTELRDAADRVLRKNYPDSRFIGREIGSSGPTQPWYRRLWPF